MLSRSTLAALAAVAFLTVPALAGSSSVHLVVGPQIEPTSTFEFRFDDAMIAPEKVGTTAATPPVVFRPAIKGAFVWLSQRSGTFKPEEPLALGTTYTVTPTPGLTKADGKALSTDFHGAIKTPPMQLSAWAATSEGDESNAPARPRFTLLFNVDVNPSTAGDFIQFVNSAGESVPAEVRRPDPNHRPEYDFSNWRASDHSLRTWQERFSARDLPPADPDSTPTVGHGANLLVLSPLRPLAAGNWRLVVKAGLPASENHLHLPTATEMKIGIVRPFVVTGAETSNALDAGCRLTISLSKALPDEVTGKSILPWVRVEPAPPNLKVQTRSDDIVFTGDFARNTDYHVTVSAGLKAAEPFVLAREFNKTVRFTEIPPRLYFEEFATHQLSTGRRQFHLLAINVPKIRVTARVFTPEAAFRVLDAYRDAVNPYSDDTHPRKSNDPFDKLAFDHLPGQTIWQRELDGTKQVDLKRQLSLGWNEILGANKTGLVLLTAEQVGRPANPKERPGVQSIVQVTDLGTVWKTSKDETLIHVFSLANGQAVAGTKLRALDGKGHTVAEATADADGVARLKGGEGADWILAVHGPDTHLVDLHASSDVLLPWRLGVNVSSNDAGGARQALLFTERPVYQPGETVHFKGIVRDWRENRPHLPAGAKATLRLSDSQDRHLVDRTVTLSDTGSFTEDFQLPSSGLVMYRLELEMLNPSGHFEPVATHDFEVQEYKPNAFEIKIPVPPRTIGPMKLTLPITAQYYMGKALSKAQMTWSLQANDVGFAPAGFEAFDFCNSIRNYDLNQKLGRFAHFAEQGKVDLDAQGTASVATTIPLNAKAPEPRTAHLLCEITDLDQQTVSQSSDFTIQSSDFYLGIRHGQEVVHAGESVPVDVIAVRTDGTPTPQPVEATVRLTRVVWQTNDVQTTGGASEYRSQPHFEFVSETQIKTRTPVQAGTKWELVPEEKGASFLVSKPGQYLLEAVSKDVAGREVITATSLNVFGAGVTGWDYRNPFQIELTADQEEYRGGQVARILVKTPISGEALVTVEREKVLRSFITQLQGNAPEIEVPLQEGDSPNVFVSVMLLRGAANSPKKYRAPEYRVGYCKLKIARPESKLMVYVKPDAPGYRPGDEVNVGAQVLDFNGHPVAHAEVTLYAVDEGVLSLMGYQTPDPLTFFNQERALGVTTGLTLPTLLPEDPAQRSFGNKGYLVGGGGDEAQSAMRKNFAACALWSGSLHSDAEGRVAAKFPAPDSLTRYRVIAVVQTATDQFGSAESNFEVSKPVMIEPALPRFANVGDQLSLRAVLHNLTDAAGEVAVRVELDGTVSAPVETRHVTLPARGSMAVDIPVTFTQAGPAVWKWTAKFTGGGVAYEDAVQTTLKVGYPVALKRELRLTELHDSSPDLLSGLNPELLEGTGTMRISLTNSQAIELREPLDSVLHYPYGCVEQTTSSMLPWLALRDFRGILPSLKKSDREISDAVKHGIDHLLTMQTGSGGLAYWPNGERPIFWGSAYGGLGLAMARRAGFPVPEDAFDRLCKYLSTQLRGAGRDDFDGHYGHAGPSDRCLALYALAVAGQAEPSYHEVLFRRRHELSAENRALLALAVAESHGPAAMIAELLKPQEEQQPPVDDCFWSSSRDTAIRLLAWSRYQPKSPNVPRLVAELMEDRINGHWISTQGDCWSLLALGDYLRRVEKADPNIKATLTWNGRPEPIAVNHQAPLKIMNFAFAKDAAGRAMPLANPDRKKIFAEVLIEARPNSMVQPRQDQGYAIRRRYAKVADDGTLSALKNPRVGDRVLVSLNIEVRKFAHYVAVDDALPACLEAINPVFKSQETLAGERQGLNWVGDHQELRADRALFFADELAPGDYTIRYLARVRIAGTATAPSARIEEMYHPERFGLTETTQLTSLPLK